MKRTLAITAGLMLAVGGAAVTTAGPAQAASVLCYVSQYDQQVVPGSTFTRDGVTILRCTGNPYASTETVTTCQPPTAAVNGPLEPYQGQDGNTYHRMTASCQ